MSTNLKSMRNRAITFKGELRITFKDGTTELVHFNAPESEERRYNADGAALIFTYQGAWYIIPFHNEDYLSVLETEGYVEDGDIYVPCSDGFSYPTDKKKIWEILMEISRKG